MIDLDWIASQPKPVAIHCPTYHDVMTVLCDFNDLRVGRPRTDAEIIETTEHWWGRYGRNTCIRVRPTEDGVYDIYRHSKSFYEDNPRYILVSIDQVKRKFDLGEIDGDESCLMSLFGMEGNA